MIFCYIAIFGVLFTAGCGGGRLIPRDLKDYVSFSLKTPRRNVDVTQTFKTIISLRVEQVDYSGAVQAQKDLITRCIEYFRRENITDYIQDTLVFHVRLTTDVDVNMKWTAPASIVRDLVKNRMSFEEFYDLCRKEENW